MLVANSLLLKIDQKKKKDAEKRVWFLEAIRMQTVKQMDLVSSKFL